MAVLEHLEPKKVFYYFEKICGIPHASADTGQISDYLANFAKEHGLRYIQDGYRNVVIFQDGTPGYEESEPVMLQGHMDMVCEKEKDADFDFARDGLRLVVNGNEISAKQTTLGGDDGIAVAMMLAILDSDEIPHPPLEAVFTTDEEIGMLGAAALDMTMFKSRLMLNLDSEEEGKLLVSCAGGATAECKFPVSYESVSGKIRARLTVTGITGGHSGVEIHRQGANSNKVLGRVLFALEKQVDYHLCFVSGGLKDNAIPRESHAEILLAEENWEDAKDAVKNLEAILQNEYRNTDLDLALLLEKKAVTKENTAAKEETGKALTKTSKDRVIGALVCFPNGVQKQSTDMEGLVQTSLNLGILQTDQTKGTVTMSFSVRSSVGTEKEELLQKLECLTKAFEGSLSVRGDYPAWEYKKDSRLRKIMTEIYERMYGEKPKFEAVHAGLECGIFAGKLPGLDCVSYGPEISGIHTTKECLYADSVERTWNYTLEILKKLK